VSDGADVTLLDATAWPAERWDELAVRSPGGHAFQSHAWGTFKEPLGWSSRRYVIGRGAETVAAVSVQVRSPALPGRAVWRRLGPAAFLYAPRGPILLHPTADAARTALHAVRMLAADLGAIVSVVDPTWEQGGELAAQLGPAGFAPARRDVQLTRTAMFVPLMDDEAAQHRLLQGATAKHVNRARRRGAVAERVDLSDAARRHEDLRELHEMLTATAARRGFPLRDREYLLAQWEALGAAGHANLWFGSVGGRRWTANLLLHCGATLFQYYAASVDDADLEDIPANHLLQWEIIRWAGAAGFARYDLGGVDAPRARGLPTDASHPFWNIYRFKRGFGAQGVEFVPAHEHVANPLVRAAWGLARRLR
jgi:lipid II:glycine glycyltransferase (peptidoglycan interpeptide bridge formation enzyme)